MCNVKPDASNWDVWVPADEIPIVLEVALNKPVSVSPSKLNAGDEALEESNRLEQVGKDPYWDNRYEIVAERFAETELQYWT